MNSFMKSFAMESRQVYFYFLGLGSEQTCLIFAFFFTPLIGTQVLGQLLVCDTGTVPVPLECERGCEPVCEH